MRWYLDGIMQEYQDEFAKTAQKGISDYLLVMFRTFYAHKDDLVRIHKAGLSSCLLAVLSDRFQFARIAESTDTAEQFRLAYHLGGIYNNITIMPSDNRFFVPVLVHEFGHAFGGLGDEYYYDDQFDTQYPPDTEPWEPNLTTLVDFGSKWADLVESGKAGLFEGGGYQSKGVYRPASNCRMKTNECKNFCPVCTRAIEAMIDYYTATK